MDYSVKAAIKMFLLVGGLCSCTRKECAPSDVLTKAVHAELAKSSPFRLEALTPFAWDKVYAFEPYTPIRVAAGRAGVSEGELSASAVEASDAISLLVFLKDGKMVKCVDFPRRYGDFSSVASDSGSGISRHDELVGRVGLDGSVVVSIAK